MIDLHCHILPGLDDGPEGMDEAVEMCGIAWNDGIRTIVATPHFAPGMYEPDSRDVTGLAAELESAAVRAGYPVRILTGADISVTPELPSHLHAVPHLSINGTGKYYLAEFATDVVPARWDAFLLSTLSSGLVPILTHPERNRWFLRNPEALHSFVQQGGLVQITASSLTGAAGMQAGDYCAMLLQNNLVHVLATDAHSVRQRRPILSVAREKASDLIGEEAATALVLSIPQAVIEGRPIERPMPVFPAKKRTWFARLIGTGY